MAQAFEGRLPSTHRQCSHSLAEEVEGNRLTGCLGADVLECDILKSLRAVIMSPIPPVVIKPEAVPVSFGNNKSEEFAEAVRCPFLLRFLAESTCAGLPAGSMSLFGHTLPMKR